MVVNIFGHPKPYKEIIKIAKKNNLKIISDSVNPWELNIIANILVCKQILVVIV